MLCTAYKYFTSNVALEYENVIMSGVVHHFDNMLETFQMMYKIPKVHCVVIGYGNMPTLLWEDVRKKWVMPWEMIEQNLVQAGFKVKRTDEHYTLRINKMQWYDTIRKVMFASSMITFLRTIFVHNREATVLLMITLMKRLKQELKN